MDGATRDKRTYLVVIDDSSEARTALHFAARRAAKTNGGVEVLAVVEPQDFVQWGGVQAAIEEEQRLRIEATIASSVGEIMNAAGIEPTIVEYLKTPPSRDELKDLIARMGIGVRGLLREKGTPYAELGLDNAQLTDEQLLDAMMAYPILINRPIVVTPLGVRLCRPSEVVLDILPAAQRGAFTKEDGERVVDEHGQRVQSRT